ncbi:unnamed protein product, partial [Meganyctiphanes norvegica]
MSITQKSLNFEKNKIYNYMMFKKNGDYLKGFSKRKTERKQKAAKQIEDEIKNEKKRIKQERREIIKKMIYSQENDDDDDDENDMEEHDITKLTDETYVGTCGNTTVEISDINLNSSKYHLGLNKMASENIKEKEEKKENKDEDEDVSKERLASLGICTEKLLYRSLQKSSATILRKNKLVQTKQRREGKKQRKQQARVKNAKEAHKKKKSRQRRNFQNDE